MTTQELRSYVDRILGNSLRVLLPSYWWKRLFGAVVDKVEELDKQGKNKQDVLVSGKNIKTINNTSLLGGGNIDLGQDKPLSLFLPAYGSDITLSEEEKASNRQVHVACRWPKEKEHVGINAFVISSVGKYIPVAVSMIGINRGGWLLVEVNWIGNIYDYSWKYAVDSNGEISGVQQSFLADDALSTTSLRPVQNMVVTNALNAKADKSQIPTKISQLEADDSYAIVIASVGFNMSRFDKNGRSLGDTWIGPNVPTRVYATSFKPNSTGRVKSIKLRHLNTQGAKSMREMFGRQEVWQDVTELDLSYFDTSSVIDMSNFAHLPNVTKLDVSSFDTSNVVDMSNMFRYCKKLTDIDLSCFNTSKVADFSTMFGECGSLKSLDLSNFDTTSATDMSYMFNSCQNLEYLNLSSFDTSNIKTLHGTTYMFSGCGNIKTLILGENFFKVAEPLESEGLQHINRVDFSSLAKWTDESVVTSLVTNSYDRIANGLPEINILLSSATMAILTDEHKAVMATKGYVLI